MDNFLQFSIKNFVVLPPKKYLQHILYTYIPLESPKQYLNTTSESQHDETNKIICAPSEDVDAHADLSLRWAHTFCWFCCAGGQLYFYFEIGKIIPKLSSNTHGVCIFYSF